ncbi:MAG: hypothetical protein ACRDLB_11825 [Actinomycetota bacterium]
MEGTTLDRKHARGALLLIIGLLGALVAAITLSSGPASAQVEPYNTQPPTVSPTRTARINTPPPERNPLEDPPDTLPFTGADLTLFLATGVAAVGTGAIVVRRTRPKKDKDKDES